MHFNFFYVFFFQKLQQFNNEDKTHLNNDHTLESEIMKMESDENLSTNSQVLIKLIFNTSVLIMNFI